MLKDGTMCSRPKLAETGLIDLTSMSVVAGLAEPTGLTGGSDRSDRSKQSPSTTRDFYSFKSCNRLSCGIRPHHPINIKDHG